MAECTKDIVYELFKGKHKLTKKKKYVGVGAMGAIQFVHITSLVGLIPLHWHTFAELMDDSLGPPKFIREALRTNAKEIPIKDCNTFFNEVHSDFVNIWGPMMTLSLLENSLCELSRTFKATSAKAVKKNNQIKIRPEMLLDDSLYCDGQVNNVVFMDEQRGTVQNFFLVCTQGSDGASELRPMLVMKHALNWEGTFEEAHITITNWCGKNNANDNLNMKWDSDPKTRCLTTSMVISEKLKKKMKLSKPT